MMNIEMYVKPELLIVAVVLYVLGLMIKQTKKVKDKYIPIILGVIGILVCFVYVFAIEPFSLMGVFTALTQGVLVAGVAVYVNQVIKQSTK